MDELKRAALARLGPHPTPAQRRDLADQLETIAAEQRRIADAEGREARRPAGERVGPRKTGAGSGRQPARFARIERREEAGYEEPRVRVYLGRGYWYDLGSPHRMSVERRGSRLALVAGTDGQYAVVVPASGMPRFVADGARDIIDLDDGRYAGEVRGRVLIIDPTPL